jgi:hypothetical protein
VRNCLAAPRRSRPHNLARLHRGDRTHAITLGSNFSLVDATMRRRLLELGILLGLMIDLARCTSWIPAWTYRGNLEPTAPARAFGPEDLLLDQDAIPQWLASAPFLPAGNNLCTTECTARQFGTKPGYAGALATQYVFRYSTSGIAQRTFDYEFQIMAGVYDTVSSWDYQSPVAQQSFFGCLNMAGNVAQSCWWAGRYDEYIVSFKSIMVSGEMDLRAFRQVVNAIDEQVSSYVANTPP